MQYIVYRVLTIIILPVFCFGISSVQLMIALLESIDIDIVKFLIISIFFMRDIENFAFGIYSFSRNFVGLSLFEHCKLKVIGDDGDNDDVIALSLRI